MPGCPGRPRSQHHANPVGVDSLTSGEPLTSWWMLSMARLYLSHSLCMLSKLKKEGERVSVSVIGLQCTQLSWMCRAGQMNAPPEASREATRLQNTNMAGQPEALCSDSCWPQDQAQEQFGSSTSHANSSQTVPLR